MAIGVNKSVAIPVIQLLGKKQSLFATFLLTVVLTSIFALVMGYWEFGIIDEMYVAEEIRVHIGAMSRTQKNAHAWLTGTVDVLYPFSYGAFFAGVAIKYFGRFGVLLATPSFLVIPADLAEGFAQIMLLNDNMAYLDLKIVSTQIKLTLFSAGLGITILGLLVAIKERLAFKD